jgi:alkylation response protein AidB-like acyl-CoA dehydrogenase
MDFALTEEQDLIRDAVAKVCEDFPDEYWAQKDADHEFPWDFYNTMSEAGWIGIAIPEAYGGSGRGNHRSQHRAGGSSGLWGGHEWGDPFAPVHVRHGAGGEVRFGRDEAKVSARCCSG